MERRSAKGKTPRRRYTVDAFEGIDELQEIRSDDEVAKAVNVDDSTEEEFEDDDEEPFDGDELSAIGEDLEEVESNDGSDVGEQNLDDNLSIAEDPDGSLAIVPSATVTARVRASSRKRVKSGQVDGPKSYTRGALGKLHNNPSKYLRRIWYFGSGNEDYKPVYAANAKWFYEPTLPSRITNSKGLGGMHRSFFVNDEMRAGEAKESSKWWLEASGSEAFVNRQHFEALEHHQAVDYMPGHPKGDLPFVMGPFINQQLFHLSVGQSVPLAHAWKPDMVTDPAETSTNKEQCKHGFMLNLGWKVCCLDWAPNQDDSDQYLAVSVMPLRDSTHGPFENPQAPAFTPQPQYKTSIQVWRFQSYGSGQLCADIPPLLKLVLCTTWGDVRMLKWCPMSCGDHGSLDRKRLGLLAGIWSDGAIRVLDLSLSSDHTDTSYIHIEKAAFESRPPATVCTCLTWISSSRIAAGCANGCIAIWDLATSLQSTSNNPRPLIYSSISTSYILSMTTCYPSRPNMLLTMSMSGFIGFTDLSRSSQGISSPCTTVYSRRIRLSHPLLLWHDFSQVALHAEDSYILQGSALRRLFTTIGLGRAKSNATSLAGSPCHPFVLVGAAHGEVFATNPLMRVIDGKLPIWQQIWFAHEWRRPTDQELTKPTTTNGGPVSGNDADLAVTNDAQKTVKIGQNGIARISGGFKTERISLAPDGRNSQRYNHFDGTQFATIYEEKSAITALAWNPNPHVGGWAAAGMGDGLLRVEDIAT